MIKYYIQRIKEEISPQGLKTIITMWILFSIGIASCEYAYADNEIYITQSGEGTKLFIEQEGKDNKVDFSMQHQGNEVKIIQHGHNNKVSYGHWGSLSSGDIDGTFNNLDFAQICGRGSLCKESHIGLHIYGDDNNVRWGQGYILSSLNDTTFAWDGSEGGGHDVTIDIHGDNNNLAGSQRNSSAGIYSEHQATFYLYSDNNNVFWRQNTDGVKTVNLYTYNDGNNVTGYQSGYATHTANISLTGSSPTTLNLSQQGNSAQSYSLSQNCQTMGGCSISVAQQ
tara:strand:- start:878 stop:1723 length:846 start_codon:yes stop_codon:yes gene_type:complete